MNQRPDQHSSTQSNRHSVRRIVLPSGRCIEVVRFHDDERRARDLHICPECDSPLVQPIAWAEASGQRWDLTLACPNCDWTQTGTFSREQIDRLEEHLDDGLAEMLDDLQRLTQANMTGELERFSAALQADLILPEDF
jgi:hypothetical protein